MVSIRDFRSMWVYRPNLLYSVNCKYVGRPLTTEKKKNDHIITRALRVKPKISFDTFTFKARADDIYLLCSDGLIKEVRHREMTDSMQKGECRSIARDLIRRSLNRGPETTSPWWWPRRLKTNIDGFILTPCTE